MTRIRRAQPADLDGIMALETATFPRDAWSRAVMRSELGGRHGYYLVAVDDDRIVGYAGLLAPAGSGQADIQTIAVAPEARRSGLGRELLTQLVAEAARRGAAHVFLEVRADKIRPACSTGTSASRSSRCVSTTTSPTTCPPRSCAFG